MAKLQDLSTRRLKRQYLAGLKMMWHYQEFRQTGFLRNVGLSKYFWAGYDIASESREILKSRGVEVV